MAGCRGMILIQLACADAVDVHLRGAPRPPAGPAVGCEGRRGRGHGRLAPLNGARTGHTSNTGTTAPLSDQRYNSAQNCRRDRSSRNHVSGNCTTVANVLRCGDHIDSRLPETARPSAVTSVPFSCGYGDGPERAAAVIDHTIPSYTSRRPMAAGRPYVLAKIGRSLIRPDACFRCSASSSSTSAITRRRIASSAPLRSCWPRDLVGFLKGTGRQADGRSHPIEMTTSAPVMILFVTARGFVTGTVYPFRWRCS